MKYIITLFVRKYTCKERKGDRKREREIERFVKESRFGMFWSEVSKGRDFKWENNKEQYATLNSELPASLSFISILVYLQNF